MINQTIRDIGGGLTDLLYPPRCAVCDTILPIWEKENKKQGICEACIGKLRYLTEPCCLKCGKEIESEDAEYCVDCETQVRSYEKGFPLYNYVPPVSDAVLAMKYNNRQEYAEFYGREIAKRFGATFRNMGRKAVLIPVPLHKKRFQKRGYNQAELIADAIGKYAGISVKKDILIRIEDTKPQKELDDKEREHNINRAFRMRDDSLAPEVALLVDDIYTTGATIEACTRVLKKAGTKLVYYTSICIGKV